MQPLPQHRTGMGTPHGGQYPLKKRRRQPLVDVAAMDARANEENDARDRAAAAQRQAEADAEAAAQKKRDDEVAAAEKQRAAEAERIRQADAEAEKQRQAAEQAKRDEAEAKARAAALQAAGAAEGQTGDPSVIVPEGSGLQNVPTTGPAAPTAKTAKKTAAPKA